MSQWLELAAYIVSAGDALPERAVVSPLLLCSAVAASAGLTR